MRTLKSIFIPGGVLLIAAAIALQGGFLTFSASAIDFYYYSVFTVGLLLAWRFHSSLAVFTLITLLLAHRAIDFFSAGRIVPSGPGEVAFQAIALLLPLNFIIFSAGVERGISLESITHRLGLLFFESVFVAVLCRPGRTGSPAFLIGNLFNPHLTVWTKIPQPALVAFFIAFVFLLIRSMIDRKPVESGLIWSLVAAFLGFHIGVVTGIGQAYFGTAGLVIVASLIENSYVLAYHDELTGLPGRRAFNEALLRLQSPYAIATVDIDHFKSFNDTYGHDTGDQVLRMVAARLERVSGGGEAYRVGGEEFSILFLGKNSGEVLPHLESLRTVIEESKFQVREKPERRSVARGTDRRSGLDQKSPRRRKGARISTSDSNGQLSVTVSIGVADSDTELETAEVIDAADKALYRAKHAGRNRVELATPVARASRAHRGTV